MKITPEDYSDMIRKICFEYAAGGYNSEGLLSVTTADAKLRWIIDDVRSATKWAAAESLKKADKRIDELEREREEMICIFAGIKWVLSSLGAANTVAYRDVEAILDKAVGEPK